MFESVSDIIEKKISNEGDSEKGEELEDESGDDSSSPV